MSSATPKLVLSTSPFVKRTVDTPGVMRHVIYSLVPVMAAAVYFFGISALLIIVTCAAGTALTEWIVNGRGPLNTSTLTDGSAILPGLLLALTLPPGLPLWMAFLGAVFAILIGKALFGGLGQNVFNPSLTGRAFIQASFPVAITTWDAPHHRIGDFFHTMGATFTAPFMTPQYDGVSAATPLAKMKFESTTTALGNLLFGSTGGSLGETCAILILLGGLYLAARRFLNWRIPVAILGTVFVFVGILHLVNPDRFAAPWYQLFAGGLMLGAIYMATDPVSSPVTPRGCWIFGIGIGLLVVVIRQFGGLPEGVMYSILLMNALVPLIDRYTQPRIYGSIRTERGMG